MVRFSLCSPTLFSCRSFYHFCLGTRISAKQSQPHRRSHSPHKTSSSASTESNSEDEYSPSSPQNVYNGPRTPAAAPSAAAAIINATAIAVTSAAAKIPPAVPTSRPCPKRAAAVPPSAAAILVAAAATAAAAAAVATPTASVNGAPSTAEAEEPQQRRPGKKHGRRDQQQQQQPAPVETSPQTSPSASLPSSSGNAVSGTNAPASSSRKGKGGRAVEDDSEEPWVVVGSKGGGPQASSGSSVVGKRGVGGVGATLAPKHSKSGGKGQRGVGETVSGGVVVPSATLPGGGGGTSVAEWASESSPAATARAVIGTGRSKVVSPSPTVVAAPSRVSPTSLSVQVVPPNGGGKNGNVNPWGISTKVASQAVPSKFRPTASVANGPQIAAQRAGPGPGSVWGASTPIVDARPKPTFSSVVPSGSSVGLSSRAPVRTNRAGVIGPPSQAAVGESPTSGASKLINSSGLPPVAQALSPSSPSVASPTTNKLPSSINISPGDKGSRNDPVVVENDGSPASRVKQRRDIPNGSSGPLVQSSSGSGDGGEALVENEKLVSFLMETGSILALAQRLEEEEEWRRAAPSPASSGPG